MNLARVLEEGMGNLILNKLFKDEDELNSALAEMLELGLIDLDLQVEMCRIKKFSLDFELNNKKYYLSVCCQVLMDKQLIPYACVVLEKFKNERKFGKRKKMEAEKEQEILIEINKIKNKINELKWNMFKEKELAYLISHMFNTTKVFFEERD